MSSAEGWPSTRQRGDWSARSGVSGDTSCADHIIAWKVRHALNLDNVPAGVAGAGKDNIIHDVTVDAGTGHTVSAERLRPRHLQRRFDQDCGRAADKPPDRANAVTVELPPSVRLGAGRNGLERLAIATGRATAEVYLHGAHVTAWQPSGAEPVLWVSGDSQFDPDKPIRGGVPDVLSLVCRARHRRLGADARLRASAGMDPERAPRIAAAKST